jgi:hypothetical protein
MTEFPSQATGDGVALPSQHEAALARELLVATLARTVDILLLGLWLCLQSEFI